MSICDGDFLPAPVVVLAAGCWSGSIAGVPAGVVPPVRPVKGQILRLAGEARRTLLQRSVRGLVAGLVGLPGSPRRRTVVVGATVEERGFDTTVTAGAVYELLRDARRVVPGVTETRTGRGARRAAPRLARQRPHRRGHGRSTA